MKNGQEMEAEKLHNISFRENIGADFVLIQSQVFNSSKVL